MGDFEPRDTNCGAHFLSPPSVFETAAFEREFVTVLS